MKTYEKSHCIHMCPVPQESLGFLGLKKNLLFMSHDLGLRKTPLDTYDCIDYIPSHTYLESQLEGKNIQAISATQLLKLDTSTT